jgi:hypothetical protein
MKKADSLESLIGKPKETPTSLTRFESDSHDHLSALARRSLIEFNQSALGRTGLVARLCRKAFIRKVLSPR